MVSFVVYGRGSFDQLDEILTPHRHPGYPMIFLVDHYFSNENGNWLLSSDNDYIIVKSKPGSQMGPSGHSIIGFTITRNAGVPSGTARKIVASITPNSGGDTDETNNTVMTAIGAN